jgi:hypothetical protein
MVDSNAAGPHGCNMKYLDLVILEWYYLGVGIEVEIEDIHAEERL